MSSDAPAGTSERSGRALGTIRLNGVTKTYDRSATGVRLRHAIPGLRSRPGQPFDALQGIDLDVAPGESIGVIGPNGAGKSTLLKVIAGVTRPTLGHVAISGRVGSMVELGLGFHPELTGWENIACSGVMLGLGRREVDRLNPSIAAFAGIGRALADPLKTYSTGMRARLGFAVASHIGAEILVVDEALAVGDATFQVRCLDRMADLRASGTTIVFVSHQMSLVADVCSRAIQLSAGRIVHDGPAIETIDNYLARSPSQYRRARSSAVHLERCEIVHREIRSWDAIEIEADIRVDHDVGTVPISIDLEKRLQVADRIFGTAVSELPELGTAGRYRIRGRTSPFPGGAGSMDVITSLVDPNRRELAGRCVNTVRIAGPVRPGNMPLAVTPRFSLTPMAGPPSRAGGAGRPMAGGGAVAARLSGVTKRFARPGRRFTARLMWPGQAGHRSDAVAALTDVDLQIGCGTAVGVIGANGAGKSTMLRLLAGVTAPDEGTVGTAGRVVPVLDLGLGFHPDLSGARNLEMSAELLGMDRHQLTDRLDAIVAFAGLGDVMDVPVKRYSTGMRARLGFALTMHADADLLLVDELLAVGDEEFRRQAVEEMRAFRRSGGTIVFVSHELQLVEQICDRVVCLANGRLVDDGPSSDTVRRYGASDAAHGGLGIGCGIQLHDLELRDRRVPAGGSLEFGGLLEVAEPSGHARLDLSYRGPADPETVAPPEVEIQERTFLHATLEPAGGALDRTGWYRLSGSVDRNSIVGDFDVVLSVVDERGPVVLLEASRSVTVGDRSRPGFGVAFDVAWQVERLDDRTALA